jgi:hypothetical protein
VYESGYDVYVSCGYIESGTDSDYDHDCDYDSNRYELEDECYCASSYDQQIPVLRRSPRLARQGLVDYRGYYGFVPNTHHPSHLYVHPHVKQAITTTHAKIISLRVDQMLRKLLHIHSVFAARIL